MKALTSLALTAVALVPAAATPEPAAFPCRAGEIRGVAEADGRTATELVCEAIRDRAAGAGTYEISLRSLGQQIILTAVRVDQGTSITVTLDAIEEVTTAASRVAEAVVGRHSLPSTQRVDNLLESETRVPLSKKGSVRWALGVNGFTPLGHGGSGAGFSIGLTYVTPAVSVPAEMRFGWGDEGSRRDAAFFALSIGGRRFFSKTDVSPFAGAGLSMLRVSASQGSYDAPGHFEGERFGAAPYLEAGVEMLRLHRTRLALVARVDVPMGPLRSPAYSYYYYGTGGRGSATEPARTRYVAPTTLGVTVTF